jgi:hypothetical protein
MRPSVTSGPPQISKANVKLIKQLHTAITAKKSDWAAQSEKQIEEHRQAVTLSGDESEASQSIIDEARKTIPLFRSRNAATVNSQAAQAVRKPLDANQTSPPQSQRDETRSVIPPARVPKGCRSVAVGAAHGPECANPAKPRRGDGTDSSKLKCLKKATSKWPRKRQ